MSIVKIIRRDNVILNEGGFIVDESNENIRFIQCEAYQSLCGWDMYGNKIIMAPSESCGLYWHEMGHAIYGALDYTNATDPNIIEIVGFCDMAEEIMCDDLACEHVGAEVYLKELEIVKSQYMNWLSTNRSKEGEEALVGLNARIDRLKPYGV